MAPSGPLVTSDIAIIGAGIVGLSIAFHLVDSRAGTVAIYEKSGVGAEASGVQPGGVRQQWSTAVNCLLARESASFYNDLSSRLECERPPRLEHCGYLFLAHSAEQLARLERDVVLQNSVGVPSRLLSAEEAGEIVPGLKPDTVVGAAYCAEDGYFDRPQAVVESFAEAALRLGARLHVAGVTDLAQDGESWRLTLADGRTARAEHVVVAAGYDSPEIVRSLGIDLPIDKDARFLFYSEPLQERLLEPLVVSPERHFAAKQLANGRVLASNLKAREEPDQNGTAWRRHVRSCIEELVPLLTYVPLPLLVEGFYDLTPDSQAILGHVDGLPNLWLAAGFSGHGFMMAPSVGRCLAAAISGDDIDAMLAPFALGRFDSGQLEPELQIV